MSSMRLHRVTGDDLVAHEAVIDVIRRGFLTREAACTVCSVSASPDGERQLLDLVRAALKDGVTVAAYIGDSIVGASVNKIQAKPAPGEETFFERFARERATDPSAAWVLNFMARIDAMADLFAEAGGEPIVELMFLGVLPEAGRQGVGLRLSTETVEVAKMTGARGVSAIWTSDYSRAIGRKLGFLELAVAEHAEIRWQGEPIADLLPDNQKRSVLALLKLD